MSREVDTRIVEMKFDNAEFEKNVEESMSTLDRLKRALKFEESADGLKGINTEAYKFNNNGMIDAVQSISLKFSALQVAGITAVTRLTNHVINSAERMVNALSMDSVRDGFGEYELKMNSVQTMMNSFDGVTLDNITNRLDMLNEYADRTIYSFSDMTASVGKFATAGVALDTSIAAIEGISNAAALAGANTNQASIAMYNISQALSTGYMDLMNWKSIELAGMATKEFKNQLIQTAKEMGTLNAESEVTSQNFRTTLSDKWLTNEVLLKTLTKYTDETTDLGKAAYEAATSVKTFSQLWGTMTESVGSGWAQTWELIIGDFEEAKKMLTSFSKLFDYFAGRATSARNTMVKFWAENGGRLSLINSFYNLLAAVLAVLKPIKEALETVFPPMTGQRLLDLTKRLEQFTAGLVISRESAETLKDVLTTLLKPVAFLLTVAKNAANFAVELAKKLYIVVAVIATMAREAGGFGNMLEQYFGNTILFQGLLALANGFKHVYAELKNIGPALKVFLDELSNLEEFQRVVRSIAEFVGTIIGYIYGGFAWLIDKLNNFKIDLSIGDESRIRIALNNIALAFRALTTAADAAKNGLMSIAKFIRDNGIFSLSVAVANGFTLLANGIKKLRDGVIGTAIGHVLQTLGGILSNLVDIIFAGTEGLKNMFSEMSAGEVVFGMFVGSVSLLILSIAASFAKLTSFLHGVKEAIEDTGDTLAGQSLRGIATSILELAGAAFIFASIPGPKLLAIAGGLIVFIGAVEFMTTKMLELGSKTKGFAQSLKSIAKVVPAAFSLYLIASAFVKLAAIPSDLLLNGIAGIGACILALIGVLGAVSTFSKDLTVGTVLLTVAATQVVKLAAAISVLAGIDDDWFRTAGLISLFVIGVLGIFSMIQKLRKPASDAVTDIQKIKADVQSAWAGVAKIVAQSFNKAAIGSMFLDISAALMIMSYGVSQLGEFLSQEDGWKKFGYGLAGIIAIAAVILGSAWVLSKIVKDTAKQFLGISTSIGLVAMSVFAVTYAIKQMADLVIEDKASFLEGIVGFGIATMCLLGGVAFIAAAGRLGEDGAKKVVIKAAGTVAALGILVLSLAGALYIMANKITPEDFSRVTNTFLLLSVAIDTMLLCVAEIAQAPGGAGADASKSLLYISILIGVAGAMVGLLSILNPDKVTNASMMMMGILATVSLLMLTMSKLPIGTNINTKQLLLITAAIGILGGIVGAVAYIAKDGDLLGSILAVSTLVGLVAVLYSLNELLGGKFGAAANAGLPALIIATLIVGGMAGIVYALSKIPLEDIHNAAIGCAEMLGVLVTLVAIGGLLGTFSAVTVAAIGGLLEAIVIMLEFAAIGAIFAGGCTLIAAGLDAMAESISHFTNSLRDLADIDAINVIANLGASSTYFIAFANASVHLLKSAISLLAVGAALTYFNSQMERFLGLTNVSDVEAAGESIGNALKIGVENALGMSSEEAASEIMQTIADNAANSFVSTIQNNVNGAIVAGESLANGYINGFKRVMAGFDVSAYTSGYPTQNGPVVRDTGKSFVTVAAEDAVADAKQNTGLMQKAAGILTNAFAGFASAGLIGGQMGATAGGALGNIFASPANVNAAADAGKEVSNSFNKNVALSVTDGIKAGIDKTPVTEALKSKSVTPVWDAVKNLFKDGSKKVYESTIGGTVNDMKSLVTGSFSSDMFGEINDTLSEVMDRFTGEDGIFGAVSSVDDLMIDFGDTMSSITEGLGDVGGTSATTKDAIKDLASTIRGSISLFDEFQLETELTADQLLNNMQSQIFGLTDWAYDIQLLAQRGMSQGLIQMLTEQGVASYEQVNAFLDMTDDQLAQANELFTQYEVFPNQIANALYPLYPAYHDAGTTAGGQFSKGIEETEPDVEEKANHIGELAATSICDAVIDALVDNSSDVQAECYAVGLTSLQTIADGVNDPAAREALNRVMRELEGEVLAHYEGMSESISWMQKKLQLETTAAGNETAAWSLIGLARGMVKDSPEWNQILKQIYALGIEMTQEMRSALGIKSPSRKFKEIGEFTMEGLANGLTEGSEMVEDANEEVVDIMSACIDEIASLMESDEYTPVITPVVDMANVDNALETIDNSFSMSEASVAMTGYATGTVDTTAVINEAVERVGNEIATRLIDGMTIAMGSNSTDVRVTLYGDAGKVFNLVQDQAIKFKKATGKPAFG